MDATYIGRSKLFCLCIVVCAAVPAPAARQNSPQLDPSAQSTPAATDTKAQLLGMLGRTSTDVGQTFASCRIHAPNPVTVACQSTVGGHEATGLFTYDRAQRVAKVGIVFAAQPSLKVALQQARALMQGMGAKAATAPAAGRAPRAWTVERPKLRGAVSVTKVDELWQAEGTFEDPNFEPAKI